MELKGKKYLKITGILMIVFGAISTIIFAIGFISGGILLAGSVATNSTGAVVGSGMIIFIFIITLAWAILELVAGIIGFKNCDNVEKAGTCFKLGVILIICTVIYAIGNIWLDGFSISIIMSMLVGLVLPVLFCYGAKLNQ
ncbi:MAG: hypothetical protein RR579_05110, partial [Eubacterium sp.]